MINITRLLCGQATPGDSLRYSDASHQRPVVVWNVTRSCNLHCLHCYASAAASPDPAELSTTEGKALIDDLAQYRVPVVLFSGGEPLLRPDLMELVSYASQKGVRPVLSTNGTLLTPQTAQELKRAGISYVGVSLDGLEPNHDRFRGKKGAFREALNGLAYCRQAGIRTGLRLTLTCFNAPELPGIFKLLEEEGIERLCFYHLVYAGRGSHLASWDLSTEAARQAMDLIFDRSLDFQRRGLFKDILTVDNHADGVYLYLKLLSQDSSRAGEVYEFLEKNGGNSSGVGIAAIDERGDVHPDQFWRHYSVGNVRQKPFSALWQNGHDPLLAGLRQRRERLKGRCGVCKYIHLCGGNFRVRAEALYGDVWAPDPACYLSDEEIGIA